MAEAPKPAAAGSRAQTKKELPERFKSYKHVWVFMEVERGQVHPVSFELLGEGRKLANKLGVELAGVVMSPPGEGANHAIAETFNHGADRVYLIEDPLSPTTATNPIRSA